MNVATITMPKDEARERYEAYREALKDVEPTDEDRGVLIGYLALARGRSVLNLNDVIRSSPLDEKGLPKLAAARAHWRWCWVDMQGRGAGQFFQGGSPNRSRPPWHTRILFPTGTFRPPGNFYHTRQRALVPTIPPNLRPARALERYVILFEAEWQPVAPKDPLLLRHLTGDLYAVLAAWDLTELERAVLAGRLSERAE